MADLINCPSCQRPLRVPDELIGRPVKCPDCGMVFLTVQGSPAAGGVAQPAPLPSAMPVPAAGGQPMPVMPEAVPYREAAGNAAVAPGIALLVIGTLGLLAALYYLLVIGRLDPQEMQAMLKQQAPPDMPAEQVEQIGQLAFGPPARTFHGVFAGVNLLIIMGAIAMLSRRLYAVAVLGSVLAIVNIEGCCCLLGIPVGIWSLVVLLRPEVSAAFR